MKKISVILSVLFLFNTAVLADGPGNAVDNYFKNEKVYYDLAGYEWAEEAIYYLADFGLIDDQNGMVYPQKYITRAEFTKLIVGAFGLYDYDAECSFADVSKDSEYYPYIAAAYKLGIIMGMSSDWFGAGEYLLRQDMATIIYRTVQKYGPRLNDKPSLDFADTDEIDEYAKEAVSALVGAKAVSGNLDYRFLPKNNANFAEACKIL